MQTMDDNYDPNKFVYKYEFKEDGEFKECGSEFKSNKFSLKILIASLAGIAIGYYIYKNKFGQTI